MNPRFLASLFPILCVTAPLFAQGEEVDLRLLAKKGTTVWLVYEMQEEQTIDANGQQMEMGSTTFRTFSMTVKDVDDKGIATIETKIVRIHGNASSMMGEMEFDSADDDNEDAAMTAGAGKTFTAKIDPNARVTELLADAKDVVESSKGGKRGGSGLDEASLKRAVESAFGERPEKPVAVGATWQTTSKKGGDRIPLEQKAERKLTKVDADSFQTTVTGTVEKQEPGEDAPAQLREQLKSMKLSNGKISGEQRMSRQDGFVLDSKHVMSFDIEASSPMGNATVEVKITQSVKRTTEAEAMSKKAAAKPAEAPKDEKKEEKKEEPK